MTEWYCQTEQYCQFRTSLNYWGSVCTIPTFLFKINFMSRLRSQQWDLWSASLLPICTWKILREQPLDLLLTPQVWYRFVNDTWVIQQQAHKQALLDHINSIDPAIKFTVEWTQGNGAIPFLDTLVTPLADESLSITVYCKPTHTDQYLQWDGHHSLSATYSVIGTLTHRAKVVCTDPELLQGEINHLKRALEKCNYPTWAINMVQEKVLNNNWEDTSNNNSANQNNIDNSQSPITQTMDNHTSQTNSNNNNQDNNQPTTRQSNKTTVGQVVIPYTK